MTTDQEERRARAEAKFKRVEAQASAGAEAKAEHDAGIAARDANTDRLKGLRLAREKAELDAIETNKARRSIRTKAVRAE